MRVRASTRVVTVIAVSLIAAACAGGGGVGEDPPRTSDGVVISDPDVGAVDGGPDLGAGDEGHPSATLFDQSEVHTFDITVEPDDLAFLDADPAAEEYVDGFVEFGGERYGPIGVRYKGSIGSFVGCLDGFEDGRPGGAKTCTKLSLKLKFDGGYDVDFFGVGKVQLHAQNLDPTLMHERLGYAMFRSFGVPAPRSTHARVTMNGELLGLFALTEQIDEEFVATVFDDDSGNLFKEVWPIAPGGGSVSPDQLAGGLRTNEDDPLPFDTMSDLADAALTASSGERLSAIAPFVDVESWLRYWVVDRAVGHDDGPLRFDCNGAMCRNKNFYLYDDPASGEVSIIAWDLDVAFAALTTDPDRSDQLVLGLADDWGEVSNGCEPFPFGPSSLVQRSAACDPVVAAFAEDDDGYRDLREEFLAGPYSQESVDALLDAWSTQIEPFVAEAAESDPDAISVEGWRAEVDRLRLDIAAERES